MALDLWDPFFAAIGEYVPIAMEKRVCNRFPTLKHANEGGTRSTRGRTGN